MCSKNESNATTGSFDRVGLESVFPFLESEEHKNNLKMLEDI